MGLYRNVVAAGLRGGWIDPDLAIAHNDAFEIEGQVAYYIDAPNLVLKTRYAYIDQRVPVDAGVAGLPFVAGKSHVATLQLTLFF